MARLPAGRQEKQPDNTKQQFCTQINGIYIDKYSNTNCTKDTNYTNEYKTANYTNYLPDGRFLPVTIHYSPSLTLISPHSHLFTKFASCTETVG